jgi:hypothetical protein
VRHQLAAELLAEIVVLDSKMEASDKTLRAAVTVTGTRLLDLYGIGPASAARILGDLGNVARFAFWNGTAPLDASSGEQQRHRLSRAGNRRINTAILAIVLVAVRHVDGHGDDDGGATLRDALPPLAKLFSRTARGAACLFDHARSSKWAAQAISRCNASHRPSSLPERRSRSIMERPQTVPPQRWSSPRWNRDRGTLVYSSESSSPLAGDVASSSTNTPASGVSSSDRLPFGRELAW